MYNERCMDNMGMGEAKKDYSMYEGKAGMSSAMPMMGGACSMPTPGMVCPPVMECPQERCVHREIVHEVPHVQPVNTRIINHHVYRHTFTPCFTCCEENVCSNVYENPCDPCCRRW